MNKIVAFYTRDGNCNALAAALAEKNGCEALELVEVKKRKRNFFGFMNCGMQSFLDKSSNLKNDVKSELASYDEILLVSPVWASRPTPAINTVLSKADLKGKKVSLYLCQADPNLSAKDVTTPIFEKKLKAQGALNGGCYAIQGGSVSKEPYGVDKFKEAISKL